MSYSEIKEQIRPFDIVFFKGGEKISSAIRFIQQVTLGVEHKADVWSHCGLVISREIYDDPRLTEGKLYLVESTLSGKLNDGIKNIDDKSFFGVQIRDLDLLAKKYTKLTKKKKKTAGIGWSRMRNNPFRDDSEEGIKRRKKIQCQFTKLFPLRWEGIRYNINLISLGASVWPILKPVKWFVLKFELLDSSEWMFCSEVVFDILQVFKFYDPHFDPSAVLPQDFLGYDNSSPGIPCLFDDPVEFTSFE